MGLKDLNKKLKVLVEQEIDIEMEEAPEEEVPDADVAEPEAEGDNMAPADPNITKDINEIIRLSVDLRKKCVNLASLLP